MAKANQIPVLLIPQNSEPSGYKVIQDTKDIIDYIEKTHPPSPANGVGLAAHPVVPVTPKRAFASMVFELLADEWLVVQAMYWRWGPGIYEKQEKFLALDFGSVSSGGDDDFDKMLSLGAKVCQVCSRQLHRIRADFSKRGSRFKGFCTGFGITTTTSPVLEKQFHRLLSLMTSHFRKYPYLLGNEITLADIAFIGSFACHLGRDPVPCYIIKSEAPLVYNWIERTMCHSQWASRDNVRFDENWKSLVHTYGSPKKGANPPSLGQDDTPESSLKIASFLLSEYMPILKDTLNHTTEYISKRTGLETALLELPRWIGTHKFKLHADGTEVEDDRAVQVHAAWMFQRVIDRTYKTAEQCQAADSWLDCVGGQELVSTWRGCVEDWQKGGWKVGRSQNRLIARKMRGRARL
ncbi:hypothetical protein BGX38DRAFT_916174 [Terfezia claveryi]|nr:hypothetical protein BGX38DRAFT_916174 [Terfezia claveryi]